MGYFSRLGCAAQMDEGLPLPVSREPEPKSVSPQPVTTPAADPVSSPDTDLAASPAEQPAADPESAARENSTVLLDAPVSPDDAARRTHEEAEARRKAEWEAKQREKKAAEQARLNRLAAMSDEDVVAASTQRVSADTEKLTRRSMKDCVSEHIQAMCRQDPDFARKTMHPRKSMMHCFWYINRKAKEFIQKEMKANGVQPEGGVYGDDVPDDLVYQWAVDYFNDPDVQEDKGQEEKFTPRPYMPKSSASKSAAKPKAKKEAPKAAPKPKPQPAADGQLSFMEVAG